MVMVVIVRVRLSAVDSCSVLGHFFFSEGEEEKIWKKNKIIELKVKGIKKKKGS